MRSVRSPYYLIEPMHRCSSGYDVYGYRDRQETYEIQTDAISRAHQILKNRDADEVHVSYITPICILERSDIVAPVDQSDKREATDGRRDRTDSEDDERDA